LREPSFTGEKTLFKRCESSATIRGRLAILDLREERCHWCSRLCDASLKSLHFGLRIRDRRTHGSPDERDPTIISCLVTLGRTELE
jgi:hypothetical protein